MNLINKWILWATWPVLKLQVVSWESVIDRAEATHFFFSSDKKKGAQNSNERQHSQRPLKHLHALRNIRWGKMNQLFSCRSHTQAYINFFFWSIFCVRCQSDSFWMSNKNNTHTGLICGKSSFTVMLCEWHTLSKWEFDTTLRWRW